MEQLILMGDEALAQGAIDGGIRGAFAYPGTPSTEIFEHVASRKPKDRDIFTQWSANEKTALEEALGMSLAGVRSVVSMKHVGLNVAADPFMNAAVTGAHGGLLVVVADDPGMHSSQNEQDTRYYAAFGYVPCLEPADQQEAYDMAWQGLSLSEELGLPVLIRLVTRLAHSRAPVIPRARLPQPRLPLLEDRSRFVLLPSNARRHWSALVDRWPAVEETLSRLPYNKLELTGRGLGVIASGVGFNYFMEAASGSPQDISYLKVGTYPMPRAMVEALFEHCERILVVEDGYPFIESQLRGFLERPPRPVSGRLDGHLPRTGELNPTLVRAALGLEPRETACGPVAGLVPRPPALCRGCPHADTYRAIKEVMEDYPEGRVLSDIGCYTLGALPPYQAIDSCVDMGASVSMAMGAAEAGVYPALAVIGDSTFAHSGMTALLDAVRADTNMVLVILDNAITAMTGRQESALTGDPLKALLVGLGVAEDRVRVINPLPKRHEENVRVFREEVERPGLSVIVPTRPCIQIRK